MPVSAWSPSFDSYEVSSCLVTRVWFPPGMVLEPHVHDRSTLAVILEGGFDLALCSGARSRRLRCPTGSILTQPAGEKHANHIAPSGAQGIVLQPSERRDALPARCLSMLDRVSLFRDGPITVAARGLARELRTPDDVTPLAVEGLVLEILAEAARVGANPVAGQWSAAPWFARATDIVHARFREPLRIQSIADEAGVHATHLMAVFRRVHRTSIASYVRRLRVDWAAERLLSSDAPISAIAVEAGFADQAHLTRWFRRVLGVTPAMYRRTRRRPSDRALPDA